MSHRGKISVVIPCYNDIYTIRSIVLESKKNKKVSEIIIVNDGSAQETYDFLHSIKDVIVIDHEKNLGKSKAMKTGLMAAKNDLILFLDSDLIGFESHHISEMYEKFTKGGYDMVIGDREKEFLLTRYLIGVLVFGERLIRRDLLIKNIFIFDVDGYLIEKSLNRIFYRKYKVGKVLLKGLGQKFKYFKFGLKGILMDIRQMFWDIPFDKSGLREFLWQAWYSRNLS